MECEVIETSSLEPSDRHTIATELTRHDSDFSRALIANTAQGKIALCIDKGQIIGWARTEEWESAPFDGPREWEGRDTLEAFVSKAYRGRGVATFAAAGLVASSLCFPFRKKFAVFHPSMQSLGRRIGVSTVLFEKQPDGTWIQA